MALSFSHRFGSFLNRHIHSRCSAIDGVFDAAPDDGDAVRFRLAAAQTPKTVVAITQQLRIRVLGNSMSGLSD